MRGPEGAWPPERPGSPLETPGLRGYKGTSKGPPEITCQIQYLIATYQYHKAPMVMLPGYMIDKPCSVFD